MIITRAPLRISFAGGGSDIRSFYENYGGCVLNTSINQYVYIEIHPFFNADRIQLKYSKTENVKSSADISHNIFRNVISKYNLTGVELTCTADIPSGTGMGSSSSFTVALLQAVHAFNRNYKTKEEIAEEACDIEINMIKSPIGKQDQYASAIGGINFTEFMPNGEVNIEPINLSQESKETLNKNLLIFYTGITRDANSILSEQNVELKINKNKTNNLLKMMDYAKELKKSFMSNNVDDLGELLNETWHLKKGITSKISNNEIDEIYSKAIKSGAKGGKILGAGGGGFLMLYCQESEQEKLKKELSFMKCLNYKFESYGSQIIFHQK